MVRGRKRIYREPLVVSIKCERELHDILSYLKLSDSEVYSLGALAIIKQRLGDLPRNKVQQYIQIQREAMKEAQENIALAERVDFDMSIKEETKRRTETRHDERGREYQVVLVE